MEFLVLKGKPWPCWEIPALWKWQPEAAPDQVPGPGFSLLIPTEIVSGGNGRFVALQGQLQLCVSMILQLQRQRSAGADYQVLHTWIWGTPPYKSALGLSRGVAWGKKHPLTCCLQYRTCTRDEMWGLLPSSPLSGDKCSDCDTKTSSVICTFRNVISLQVK